MLENGSYTAYKVPLIGACKVLYSKMGWIRVITPCTTFAMSNNLKPSIILLLVGFCGYSYWIIHIYNVTGGWVYPFLTELGTDFVLYKFIPITSLVAIIIQYIGFKVHETIHCTKKLKEK